MSAKKGKSADLNKQLPLPFGQPQMRTAAHQESNKRIISFQERLKGKTAENQCSKRKAVIQCLLDHANTLPW
jgi:hypothetical protein